MTRAWAQRWTDGAALAMVVQGRDLELLGLAEPDARSRALQTLDEFWNTAEISGVALVDMAVWHWLYEHPGAAPSIRLTGRSRGWTVRCERAE